MSVARLSALLLAGALSAGAAAAQQGEPAPRPEPGADGRPPHEEAFKMVDAYFVSNVQESLGLSDDQYVKLLPLVQRMQKDRRELTQRRMHAMLELRRLFKSGQATEASVTDLLAELKRVESEMGPTLARDQQAIDAQLTPVQQAKYRLLEAEVERKVRELLFRARPGAEDRPRRFERRPPRQP